MPDISIIVPTLDPDPTFGWEDQLDAATVDGAVVPRDDPTASGARNAGIREAASDKLVFLDDDSSPTPGYFDRVSALLDDHPAVTGRIIDTGTALVRGLSGPYDQGDQAHRTETVVGCNMAVRRSVLEDVGGFEERLPYGHEERELVDRICEQYYVWYDPELVVEHPYADSVLDYYGKAYRHGREEIVYYQLRGRDVHREIARNVLLPTRYLGSSLRGTLFSTTGQLARIAGHVDGYLRYMRGERAGREVDRQNPAEDEPDTP
jgi:glycosyltransferase involved in cell wall biosynthesis